MAWPGNGDAMRLETYYKPVQVAYMLDLSTKTIYRLVKRGDLQAVRFGRLLRIGQRAIDEMLAAIPQVRK